MRPAAVEASPGSDGSVSAVSAADGEPLTYTPNPFIILKFYPSSCFIAIDSVGSRDRASGVFGGSVEEKKEIEDLFNG